MLHEFLDDDLRNKCAGRRITKLVLSLEVLLDSYHRLNAATVHEFHHKVNLAFLVKDAMVLNEGRKGFVDHLKFIVELMALVFIVKVDDLHKDGRFEKFES